MLLLHAPRFECAERSHDIGYLVPLACPGGGVGRVGEYGVNVNDVVPRHVFVQPLLQRARELERLAPVTAKEVRPHAMVQAWFVEFHGKTAIPVGVGRAQLDIETDAL
jgi:hypothetical protein